MLGFTNETDKRAFLEKFASTEEGNEDLLRFAAYQALFHGLYETSAQLLEKIRIYDRREFLAVAIAHTKLENWDKAEEVVQTMTTHDWPYISDADYLLLYQTLEAISSNRPLRNIPDSYVNELRQKVKVDSGSFGQSEIDLGLLCPE
jgi:hypothetical protein